MKICTYENEILMFYLVASLTYALLGFIFKVILNKTAIVTSGVHNLCVEVFCNVLFHLLDI